MQAGTAGGEVARSAPGLLAAAWAHRRLVLGGLLAGLLSGYLLSVSLPRQYTAEARLILSSDSGFSPLGDNGSADPARHVGRQADFLMSEPVLRSAGQRLGGRLSVEELRQSLTVESSPESARIPVRATRPSAREAQQVANAVIDSYRGVVREQVAAALAAAEAAAGGSRDLQQIRLQASLYGDGVALVEEAPLPGAPSSPATTQTVVLAGLLGLLAGLSAAFVKDLRRAERVTVADLESRLGAPLLGRISADAAVRDRSFVPAVREPQSPMAAAARTLLVSLDYALGYERERSVLVTSARRGQLSTSVTLNVAVTAAAEGRDVVVVDADAQRPMLSMLTGVGPHPGYEQVGENGSRATPLARTWEVAAGTSLRVVPQPASRPGATPLRPAQMGQIIRKLQQEVGLTLVDGPPLLEAADALALAGLVDGLLLVLDEDTSYEDLDEVRRRLTIVGVPLLGYVITNRSGAPWLRWRSALPHVGQPADVRT